MRYGEGASYESGMRYGGSARGSTRFVMGGGFHWISMRELEWMLPDPIIEKPLPVNLRWTEMNTGWNKKRGKK